MSDNLRVTTPIINNDTINRVRPTKEQTLIDIVDPTKVTSRNENEDHINQNYTFNKNSVFNKFIQQLNQTPELAESLKKILFDAFVRDGKIKPHSEIEVMLSKLMPQLKMTPEQMAETLKFMQNKMTKFSGPFFETIRSIVGNAKDPVLKEMLGRFLKAYDDFYSADDITKSIKTNLVDIGKSLPRSFREKLEFFMSSMNFDAAETQKEQNLEILKQRIIPFLSEYISKTNDFGRVRNAITLLIHNISRLNTSSKELMGANFDNLMDYCRFNLDVKSEKINFLREQFMQLIKNNPKEKQQFFDSLMNVISEGLKEDNSTISRGMYRDVLNSLLLNNNAFMPLTHLFLPVNYNGTFMFSEIWIDKNSHQKNTKTGEVKKGIRLFINFDIKSLGYFEAVIFLSEKNANVEVNYPVSLSDKHKEIKENVNNILLKNGIIVETLILTSGEQNKTLEDVFPNLYERKREINVVI